MSDRAVVVSVTDDQGQTTQITGSMTVDDGGQPPDFIVSTAAELNAVLGQAVGGQIIELLDGFYGDFYFTAKFSGSYVVLRSQIPYGSVFRFIDFNSAEWIKLQGIQINYGTGPSFASMLNIRGASKNICLDDCDIHGSLDPADYLNNPEGIHATNNSSDILIENSYIHHSNKPFVVFDCSRVTYRNNVMEHIAEDAMLVLTVVDGVIENNFARWYHHPEGAHHDFLQAHTVGRGPNVNLTIRGNVLEAPLYPGIQGIFMTADPGKQHQNVTIEQNILITGARNAIVAEVVNSTIRDNEVITICDPSGVPVDSTTAIDLGNSPGPVLVERNVCPSYAGSAAQPNNQVLPVAQYSTWYAAPFADGVESTWQDFVPLDMQSGFGALARFAELMGA